MPHTHERRTCDGTAPTAPAVKAEQNFRCLFEGNPAAVLWLDAQGHVVEANPALQTLFGYEPQALAGQALSVLIPDWDRPEVLAELAQRRPHEATLRHAQGRRCDVVVTLLPAPAPSPAPVSVSVSVSVSGESVDGGYFLVARDVTVQRRRQRQMQVQTEILARTHDAMVVLDEAGDVQCWSASAARLYGVSAQDMAGQAFAPLFEAPDRARLLLALADAGFDPSAPTQLELRRSGPQGRESDLVLSLTRMTGVERGSALLVVQGQDLSARLQVEAAERGAHLRARRGAEQQQRLIRSTADIGRHLGRKAQLQHLADVARVQVGAHQSAIWLLDGPQRHPAVGAVSLSVKYTTWRGDGAGLLGAQALSCLAWCVLDQGAVAQSTELQLGRYSGSLPATNWLPPLSWVAAPVFDGCGQAIGLLQLLDRYDGDFDEQDLAVVQQLASVVSAALVAADDADRDHDREIAARGTGMPQ